MAVLCVDDLLLWSIADQHIIDLGNELNEVGADLEEEGGTLLTFVKSELVSLAFAQA